MAVRATRFIVWGVAGLVVAALVYALQPQPLQADFVTIGSGPLRVTLDEEGETRVRDRFMVSAPLAGRVLRIELEPGDPVAANETVLATFLPVDPTLLDARTRAEIEARVRAAESAVGRAEVERERAGTELEFAESDLERYRHLDANALISKEQLDATELRARTAAETRRSAEFTVSNARYELEVAQASLLQARGGGGAGQTITLRSPIDGVVLRRLRESEAIVPVGEPLMEIADPAQLEIVSDFLSTDAVRIKPGQPVLIEQWGGDRALAGRVRRVEPYGFTKISALGVEEQRVNVVIDFEDVRGAWEALGDGYRVEVRAVIWEENDVLKVPTSSLFRNGDDWAVYAVAADTAALTHVEIGQRNGLEAQIVSGLSEGDEVIAYPSDAIADGVEVVERP